MLIVVNCAVVKLNKQSDHGLRHKQPEDCCTIDGERVEKYSQRHLSRDNDRHDEG